MAKTLVVPDDLDPEEFERFQVALMNLVARYHVHTWLDMKPEDLAASLAGRLRIYRTELELDGKVTNDGD